MRNRFLFLVPILVLALAAFAAFASEGEYEEIYLVNGDFEEGYPEADGFMFIPQDNVSGWYTTAPDGIIEIWRSGFRSVESYEGTYHAEINANMFGTLYQVVDTVPGSTIHWEFAHRGRAGVDSIALLIGPENGDWIQQTVVTTGKDAWQLYSGTYIVPEGQTRTAFAYEAVSTHNDHPSIGNFLDGIRFGMFTPSEESTVVQTPFVCDSSLYVALGEPTRWTRVNTQTFEMMPLQNGASQPFDVNGIGFNHMDGFIYGVGYKATANQADGELYRIGADGVAVSLGVPVVPNSAAAGWASLTSSHIHAGTMLPDGSYLIAGPGGHAIINLPGLPPNAALTEPTVISAGTYNLGGAWDVALNPLDGRLYGYVPSQRRFGTFDLNAGSFSPLGTYRTPDNLSVGSVFFAADGTLYAYGKSLNGSGRQDTLHRVDLSTGEPVAVGSGDAVGRSDGTSCAYGQEFSKSVPQDVRDNGVRTGDVFTYTFTFSNSSGQAAADVSFTDTLPEGLVFVGNSLRTDTGVYLGTTVGGQYDGEQSLSIQGMQFPVGISGFSMDVRVVGEVAEETDLPNQAFLTGGSILGQSMLSDDPVTPEIDDATTVTLLVSNMPPTIEPISDQVNQEGSPVQIQVIAEDGGPLRYTDEVDGTPTLPPGLSIDPATGIISGTLAEGSSGNSPYTVTITVIDTQGESASTTFTWTVTAPTAPEETETPGEPAPQPDGYTIEPLEVCWTTDPNGMSIWQVTNNNPVPLVQGEQAKVVFDWEVFGRGDELLQEAQRWDQTGTTPIHTPMLSQRMLVHYYVWNNGVTSERYTVEAYAQIDLCEGASLLPPVPQPINPEPIVETPEPQPELDLTQVETEPLEVCWFANPNENSTQWYITNYNRVPLVDGFQAKVVFDWEVFDAQGNSLQSAQQWDQTGITLNNTVLADRIDVTYYIWDNGRTQPLGMVSAYANQDDSCTPEAGDETQAETE